ncbi:class I SAM-dependent methyltransferase [Ornithinimicrobium humiphilum]|uniref:Putative O-methyltransferase YrrM n=1 Tax=Ornithinimicrobium humiphilum TaxID=125288 RepID=A0A543KR09_9MICO|nr:class I SAM-dependent methyltransferase [Ornithinimicrobium humiphilum]TQM97515.1 putative O-methyltransferase YrrM [Ornithinimicrobium humiphilum]
MAAAKVSSLAYSEDFITPHPVIERAQRRGEQLGAAPVSNGAGATLRLLAATVAARHVVEVGTGAGSSGLWLLQGMPRDGVLTSIDDDPEVQRAAKEAYAAAGIPSQRTRVITGEAEQVLGRLTDGAYDLVLVDADVESSPVYAEQAVRLLRAGGVLVVNDMLGEDRVADPAARDEVTTLLRDLGKKLRDDDRLVPLLLPVGGGLLVAVRR